jgi:hypothetical protein
MCPFFVLHPVVCIGWSAVQDFLRWLSQKWPRISPANRSGIRICGAPNPLRASVGPDATPENGTYGADEFVKGLPLGTINERQFRQLVFRLPDGFAYEVHVN